MKHSVRKFFILGLGIAAAGVTASFAGKNKKKIKKALHDLVRKEKLMKEEAIALEKELVAEVKKLEKKVKKIVKPKK